LVIAVGAYSQSKLVKDITMLRRSLTPAAFGIPGVKEHAHFLKTIADARNIRQRIVEC
jgi:NADH:ubiquinone reductase (non-electrogenic)